MRSSGILVVLLAASPVVPSAAAVQPHTNGTLVDPQTGLTWCADAGHAVRAGLTDRLVVPRADGASLVQALNAGAAPNFGRQDWRLPTAAELARRVQIEAASREAADLELLRGALAQVQAGRGDLVALVPVRNPFIPPGFPDVVVFATNSIHVKNDSVILSGDVVANDASSGPALAGAELVIGPHASSSAASALKADSVRVKSGTQVGGDVYYNGLVNQGTIDGLLVTPLALPVFASAPSFKTGTPGTSDVVVPSKGTLTLAPGAYRRLDAGQAATVYFTGGAYDFESIAVGADASLLFDAASDVRVAGKFQSGPDTLVAPSPGALITAADVVFYVAGSDGESPAIDSTQLAAEVGVRNYVRANFYVPGGTLQLKNGTSALGAFLGRDVEIGPHATLALQSAFFNRAPVALPDSATVERQGTVTVLDSGADSLLANDSDPDGDVLTVTTTPVSGPSFGTLTLAPDGTFSYTHAGGDASADTFVYEVCDQGFPVLCATASVTITIVTPPYNVTVTKDGSGTGRVVSTPAGIDCGATCSAAFPVFTIVTLTATADPGSFFAGFSGGPGCAGGVVTGPPDVACTATFRVFVPVTLSVVKAGTGSGYVGSDPAGIDCGPTCSADFPLSTRVQLSPVADAGSMFAGYGGDPDCLDGLVSMNVAKTCLVFFDPAPPPPSETVALSVQKLGAGGGTVTSDPAGIDCGATCSALFPQFSRVELSAVADEGSVFVGFGGDADCADGLVALAAATACTATFDLAPPPIPSSRLTVVLLGGGTGTVTSNPAGINCGATCEALFPDGGTVTLFARPEEGVFAGWGGDCAGASFSTSVTIGPDKTCTATFAAP